MKHTNETESNEMFAVILKGLLTKKHFTQKELSDGVGLSYATITNYAQGKSTPTQKNLLKIAKFLDVSPQVFYGSAEEYIGYINSIDNVFASNFSALVKKSGKTQEQIAQAIGVSRQTINYYTNGKMLPMHDVLTRIADYFNVTVDDLLAKNENAENENGMKIIVAQMPTNSSKCIFKEYVMCGFGGICDFHNGRCSHLCTLSDVNIGAYVTYETMSKVGKVPNIEHYLRGEKECLRQQI